MHNPLSSFLFRRFLILLLLLHLFTLPAKTSESEFPFIQEVEGKKVESKLIYVKVWASWCLACRVSFKWLAEIEEKYADQGLVVYTVNYDEKIDTAKKFIDKNNLTFKVFRDRDNAYASKTNFIAMPSSFLYNENWQLLTTHIGFYTAEQEKYEQEIIQYLDKLK